RVEYDLTVSGDLEKSTANGGSINAGDEIDGSTASGAVVGGTDSYGFAGDHTDLSVSDASAVTVYVDGEAVDPAGFGPERSISIVGSGPRAEYDFTVSGELEKTTARGGSINSGDTIDGSSATGYVLGGTDSYGFAGEVTDFSVSDPDAVSIYLDGEQVTPGGSTPDREITVSNRPYDTPASYQFSVSGVLEATDSVNFADGDEISGSGASGRVNQGSDTYRFSGEVLTFDNDGPVEVIVDGDVVRSSAQS
ncbi:hypothetical protein BRD01_05445, partial [Halobacteriales archaeon QS_8_65_32]